MKITVVGSINMDMVIQAPRLPQTGETLHGSGFFLSSGGKGANQAVSCSKMGAQTSLIGRVGTDVFGKTLRENLHKFGVNTQYVTEIAGSSGVAVITVFEGNNTIVLDAGSNAKLTPEDISAYEQELLSSDAILLQMEIPMETNCRVIELCKGKVPIFLNPAPATEINQKMLEGLDYFTPNETEAPFYTNIPIHSIEDAYASLDVLRGFGVRFPVITLGERGVVYFNGTKNVHHKALRVQPIDTTAAGDTFAGALATKMNEGIDKAVAFACVAASISVTRKGAGDSIPTLEEVNARLDGSYA